MHVVSNNSVPTSQYRDLPLSQLRESPSNPRRRYNQTALEELAASIRSQGVLAPLLVRQLEPGQFEVIAGSRRFRAAQIAELSDVPVRIVEMSDGQVLETQCVENLQREDVHPLEEGNAFTSMLRQQYDVAAIAARIGKPPAFVMNRIQLTQLIPSVSDAFLADKLTVGHASLIAKLPAAQQPEAFTASFRNVWMSEGQTAMLVPVKELAMWIESNILMELRTAPFDRKDATLLPEAGSCHECPKRTGANALLFPETRRDACLDRQCFQMKINAHIERSVAHYPKLIQLSTSWGSRPGGPIGRNHYVEITLPKAGKKPKAKPEPGQTKCPHTTQAIVVDGGNRGHFLTICAEPTCAIHHADAMEAKASQNRVRQELRRQENKRKEEIAARFRILDAVLKKVSAPLKKADLELVVQSQFERLSHDGQALLCKRRKVAKEDFVTALAKSDEEAVGRVLIEIALLELLSNSYSSEALERFEAVAKRYRVVTTAVKKRKAA